MRQFLSVVLSFSVLLSSVPVVQGQPVAAANRGKRWLGDNGAFYAAPELPSDTTQWPEHLQKKVQVFEEKFKEQANSVDDKLFKAGEELAQTECRYGGLKCADEMAFNALRAANWDQTQGEVCSEDGKNCVPLLAFAQGAIHWGLKDELYYKGKILVSSIPALTSLIITYGVHSKEDQETALEFFYQAIEEAKKDCGKGYMEYGSSSHRADARQATERKANLCNQEMAAVYGAAMLSTMASDGARTIKNIVSLLNKKYNSAAAGVVIPAAASALATIGTAEAYEALYNFLMKESLPTAVGDVLNSMSVEGVAKGALGAASDIQGANFRYLNRINESFQYLDAQEAGRQGYGNTSFKNEKLQYPYGNLLEDVGRLLGEESGDNKEAAKVAQNIVKQANKYLEGERFKKAWQNSDTINASGDIHYPVVLGILDGWRTQGKDFIYIPSPKLLEFLYKGDWWDLNEGTQQRVHYKAWQFAKARGWTWKKPVKDEEKLKRYVYNKRILDIAQGADVALIPVFLVTLVASVPSMAKGLANSVRWLRANRKFIGYRLVSLRQPAVAQNAGKAAVSASKRAATPAAQPAALPRATAAERAQQTEATSRRVAAEASAQTVQRPIMAELEPALSKSTLNGPKLSSVPQAQMDNSLFGSLNAKMKALGQNVSKQVGPESQFWASGKSALKYTGNLVEDYFKALLRPTNTLQMSVPGIPAPGAWSAVRQERKLAELAKASAGAADAGAALRAGETVGTVGKVVSGAENAAVKAGQAASARPVPGAAKEFFRGLEAIDRSSQPGSVVLRYKNGTKVVPFEEYNAMRAEGLVENKSLISRLESKDFMYGLEKISPEGKYVFLQYTDRAKPVRLYADEYEMMLKGLGPQQQASLQAIEGKNWSSVKAIDGDYIEVVSADGKVQHLTPAQAKRLRVPVPQTELDKMARLNAQTAAQKEIQSSGLTRVSSLAEREIVPAVVNKNTRQVSPILQQGLVRVEQSGTDARNVNMYFLDAKGNVSVRTESYSQYQNRVADWSQADANLLKSRAVQYENRIAPVRARQEMDILNALHDKYLGSTSATKDIIRQEAMPIIEDLSSNKLITPQRKQWWMDKFQ